ncbi:hypothetical protein C5167_037961 [Papaver somniferum]|uniref:Protein kinase domain-containing protein n=1 Tax=Papaver somniferum TaxID=3469 RepID=A0A4Y7IAF4_PAPSO|nr:hypothetical protein C5167_037961 [Papaver somniferum]
MTMSLEVQVLDNLLLTANQKSVKLADFGLSREEWVTEMMTAETLYNTVTLRQREKKHYNNKAAYAAAFKARRCPSLHMSWISYILCLFCGNVIVHRLLAAALGIYKLPPILQDIPRLTSISDSQQILKQE